MDMIHTFVVLTHNNKHDARVHTVYETVHVPGKLQANYWGYTPWLATTMTKVTHSGYYLPVILTDLQMLPGCTVIFSNSNNAFRQYRSLAYPTTHNALPDLLYPRTP